MTLSPELSVIIVNINGSNFLIPLLDSIKNSVTKNYEVIVVDNGSNILEIKKIEQYLLNTTKIKLIKLHKNYGPATARNIGVTNSSGRYLSFLDNDTIVDKKWSLEALNYFQKHKKVGIIQCKLLLQSDHSKLDYVGEFLGSNGFLVQECSGGDQDLGQFDKPQRILAAKSAGMFMRRDAFDKAGGFDDDYFIYVEETDLGWRSWLVGYESHFVPTSIVYHHFGTSNIILGKSNTSYLAKFHGPKNYITTLFKNLSTPKLIYILPIHILLWLGLCLYRIAILKPIDAFIMIKGIIVTFINFPTLIYKRKIIQDKRLLSDTYLFKHLVVSRSLWYFINKAIKTTKVGNAQSY